jgi:hypothetical protein
VAAAYTAAPAATHVGWHMDERSRKVRHNLTEGATTSQPADGRTRPPSAGAERRSVPPNRLHTTPSIAARASCEDVTSPRMCDSVPVASGRLGARSPSEEPARVLRRQPESEPVLGEWRVGVAQALAPLTPTSYLCKALHGQGWSAKIRCGGVMGRKQS